MKTWEKPAMEDLSVSETSMTNSTGIVVDGGTWNNQSGEITKTYYASGEKK